MVKLTEKERAVMGDLQGAMAKAFRSKPTLKVLSELLAKGMIEWDAMAGTGKLTEAGLEHLR